MRLDPETYLVRIADFMKANLNTQIAAMNTEKNDSIVLNTVNTDGYAIQSMNEAIMNYDPYILVGLDDIQSRGIGPAVAKTLVFQVIIVVADAASDLNMGLRMLRYMRVMEDFFCQNFNSIFPSAKFKVNSLVPVGPITWNSNDPYRATGVELTTELG
jgi:hypothetical protein